jgi:hypothetical protein
MRESIILATSIEHYVRMFAEAQGSAAFVGIKQRSTIRAEQIARQRSVMAIDRLVFYKTPVA